MSDLLQSLRPLFEPRHVAIIGASRTPGKRGHTVTRNLIRGGFPGRISPINPGVDAVEGLRCYDSIGAVPEPVDCAFLALPAEQSLEAARQCAAAGVRSIVVGSNGFAETGTEEGRAREAELTALARACGMRVIGPNTNGILNAAARFSLGYNHSHGEPLLAGRISIVSHSGAMFDGVAGRLRRAGVGLAKFAPVGNEADLDLLDLLEYFIIDPATDVIGLVIEGLSDGARLRDLAARAEDAGKPIVALKVGRSAVGVEASLAHSSRLAGSARAYDALFAASGIAGVRSVEALVGACLMLEQRGAARGDEDRRIICVTSSGAGGALVADFAETRALPFAGNDKGEWQEPARSTIDALPTIAAIRNPIDTGSLGNWKLLTDIFAALQSAGNLGPVVVYAHNMPELRLEQTLAGVLAERRRQVSAPVVILSPGGLSIGMEELHRANGVALFHDSASCFESLAAYDFAVNHVRHAPDAPAPVPKAARELIAAAWNNPQRVLSETDSAAILEAAGLPMVRSITVTSADAAATAASYPAVLKALAPGVAHKHVLGLVIPRIGNEVALRAAHATLQTRLATAGFDADDATIILQKMVESKVELFIGVSHEARIGHFLVAGLGGNLAELLDQVILMPVPSSRAAMRERLSGALLGAILRQVDPAGTCTGQLLDALAALQALVREDGALIESIDVNPILVDGNTCMAVDALVVLRAAT